MFVLDVRKEPGSVIRHSVSREDLLLINRLAKSELGPDQVYTFAVRLCDNEVDRDWERFDEEALEILSGLFVGKSGIFDHNWSAEGQTARLYRTEVCREGGATMAGDGCQYLKGYAYMLRNEKNSALIEEIEAGIKKEVSVGCSVSGRVCSICGKERCGHQGGRRYDGKLCYFTLREPTDAYEWSFVAVPAQRKAGVIKAFTKEQGLELKRLAAGASGCVAVSSLYAIFQRLSGLEVNTSYVDMDLNADMPSRVLSFFDNPNTFAEVLILLLPLTLALILCSKHFISKLAASAAFVLGAAALGMTYCRAAWIGMACAMVVMLFLWKPKLLPLFFVLCVPCEHSHLMPCVGHQVADYIYIHSYSASVGRRELTRYIPYLHLGLLFFIFPFFHRSLPAFSSPQIKSLLAFFQLLQHTAVYPAHYMARPFLFSAHTLRKPFSAKLLPRCLLFL